MGSAATQLRARVPSYPSPNQVLELEMSPFLGIYRLRLRCENGGDKIPISKGSNLLSDSPEGERQRNTVEVRDEGRGGSDAF